MRPSAIGWTDYSGGDLNFVTGCTPVSEGCAHCYARAMYARFGRDFGQVAIHSDKLERVARRSFANSRKSGHYRAMCFVCDTGDLFHEAVPAAFIYDVLDMMYWRADVIWQILTKRPQRILEIMAQYPNNSRVILPGHMSHVWLGVTAENQRCLDERLPYLASWPGSAFLSVEPMLEPVTLARQRVGWVICGAESGPWRRPFDAAWAEALYGECKEMGIPFFAKQDSATRPGSPLLIHGKEVKEWPRFID